MAGVWIISENREQALELLILAANLPRRWERTFPRFSRRIVNGRKTISKHGADEVLILPPLAGDQSIDAYIPIIVEEAKKDDPDLILIPATARGKDMAARIASRLDTGLCSSCMSIAFDEASKTLVMERLAYGGAAVQKVICTTRPAMATIPPRTYEPAMAEEGRQGQIRELPAPPPSAVKVLERKVKERVAKDITEARVIVCVGRGMEKKRGSGSCPAVG